MGAFYRGSILSLFAVTLAGVALAGLGCAVETTPDDETDESDGAQIGAARQAISQGWTNWTSEEYPPIGCDSGSGMTDFQCRGSYCDDIRAYCGSTGGTVGSSYWTSPFSEEGSAKAVCSSGYWVTGMSCTGRYCDNVALQCTALGGISEKNCYWTGWVSEENGGTLSFGTGYFMRGARCSGRYCDNMSFLVCQR